MKLFNELKQDLQALKNPAKAKQLQRFFKTGPGEYGEGDVFLGIVVPEQRKLVKKYRELDFASLVQLINSPIHEERLIALLILVERYKTACDEKEKQRVFNFYVKHMKQVNNWDLVDLSAHHIIGCHLFKRDRVVLKKWARSKNLWVRRVAVLATFYFIRQNDFKYTLKISDILLKDKEDLIHKAVGWMLREVGKRDLKIEEKFLRPRYKSMPRTMLRYAIERFAEPKRLRYLHGLV
jgi:3-methyladenine DNA glycosylase AlkD